MESFLASMTCPCCFICLLRPWHRPLPPLWPRCISSCQTHPRWRLRVFISCSRMLYRLSPFSPIFSWACFPIPDRSAMDSWWPLPIHGAAPSSTAGHAVVRKTLLARLSSELDLPLIPSCLLAACFSGRRFSILF